MIPAMRKPMWACGHLRPASRILDHADSEAYARAIAAARKAVELDDSLAEAHRALAFAEWWGNWDFVDGDKEFRRAIELNPKDPVARKWYANVLLVQGRFLESLEESAKAQELDPSSPSILPTGAGCCLMRGESRRESHFSRKWNAPPGVSLAPRLPHDHQLGA